VLPGGFGVLDSRSKQMSDPWIFAREDIADGKCSGYVDQLLADADMLRAAIRSIERADETGDWSDYWDAVHEAIEALPEYLRGYQDAIPDGK